MKRYLYILVSILFFATGCKRDVVPTPDSINPSDEEMLSIGVSRVDDSQGKDVFVEGDQLGIYMIAKVNDDKFNDFIAKNYSYQLTQGVWSAINASEVLKWHRNDPPVYLYSYSPRAVEGGYISLLSEAGAGTDTAIGYRLPYDQSDQGFRGYDLLRCANRGVDNEGLSMILSGGSSVKMRYSHVLSKIRFNVYMTKHSDVNVPSGKAILKKVKVISSDIANEGVLSLKDGSVTKTNSTEENTWFWNGNLEFDILAEDVVNPVFRGIEFVVSPFVASQKATWFEFEVAYVDDKGVDKNFVCRYIVPADGSVKFLQGMKAIFNTKVNINNENLEIEAGIADWQEENYTISPIG